MERWISMAGSLVSVITLCGVLFNYSVIKPLNQAVTSLRQSVDCLRAQLRDTEQKRQGMAERLSRVEEMADHALHRLDVLEKRSVKP